MAYGQVIAGSVQTDSINNSTGFILSPPSSVMRNRIINGTSGAIRASYTVTSGRSAVMVGPITIASGASITIPNGSKVVLL